jgi:uncharacterized protein (DUF58 family)
MLEAHIMTPHNYKQLLQFARTLQLRMLRYSRGSQAGHHTTQRVTHSGLEFDTLLHYEMGDDIRRIDWNSSVRTGSLMVRSFREVHNRTIIIAIDISPSLYAGSTELLKSHLATIIATALTLVGEAQRDTLGLCLTYNEQIVEYLPPLSGKAHFTRCVELLLMNYDKPKIREAPTSCSPRFPRHAWIVLITDGLLKNYESWWRSLASRNMVSIVRIRDRYERTIPQGCTVRCYDPETQKSALLTSRSLQEQADMWYSQQWAHAKKHKIPCVDIIAGEPYETKLATFFSRGR